MAKKKNTNDNKELSFELIDLEIFKIPDLKLKLDTIQNYFFPRLDILMDRTLGTAREVYGASILDDYTISKSPRHRPSTKFDNDRDLKGLGDFVRIGIAGLRNNGELIIKRKDGKFSKAPPIGLDYSIDSYGCFSIDMSFWGILIKENNEHFLDKVREFFKNINETIMPIFNWVNIDYHSMYYNFEPLYKTDIFNFHLFSETYNLPVGKNEINHLQDSFIMLMPIWHALVRICRGKETLFDEHIKNLKKYNKKWLEELEKENDNSTENTNDKDNKISKQMLDIIDNLDDYEFLAAGKRWQVLRRDNWTCCSCGRSAKDGVILHIDHINPKSLGGTDDIDNLQTLCSKCNLGKSNKDDTDLRNL